MLSLTIIYPKKMKQSKKRWSDGLRLLCALILIVPIFTIKDAAAQEPESHVSKPRHSTTTRSLFLLDKDTYVTGSVGTSATCADFAQWLRSTGVPASSSYAKARNRITFHRVTSVDGATGADALRVVIKARRINVYFTSDNALLRAISLLRARINSNSRPPAIPTGVILDWGPQSAARDRDATIDLATSMRSMTDIESTIKKQAARHVKEIYVTLVDSVNWRMPSSSLDVAASPGGAADPAGSALYPADGRYTAAQLKQIQEICHREHIEMIPTLELLSENEPIRRTFGHSAFSVEGMRLVRAAIENCAEMLSPAKICLGTDSAAVDARYREFITTLVSGLNVELVILKP